MKKLLMAFLLGLSLFLVACGGDDGSQEPAETEDATETEEVEAEESEDEATDEGEGEAVSAVEELYEDSCASCHAGDFALTPGGEDFSVAELEEIILDGIGDMPAIDVSDEEATLIAEYLTNE